MQADSPAVRRASRRSRSTPLIHGSLSASGYPLKSPIERGRHVQFANGSHRGRWPDDGEGRAGHDRARPCVHGALAFLGLQSGQTLVAQARAHYRHLLLVLRAGICAHLPHRAAGARRRRHLQHSRARRTDRILRQWPWAAVGASALGAGDIVSRCVRLHAVLAAPHVSRRRDSGSTMPSIIPRRISSGSRRRGFTPSICSSERSWSTSSC